MEIAATVSLRRHLLFLAFGALWLAFGAEEGEESLAAEGSDPGSESVLAGNCDGGSDAVPEEGSKSGADSEPGSAARPESTSAAEAVSVSAPDFNSSASCGSLTAIGYPVPRLT